jgi:hypothetical protein
MLKILRVFIALTVALMAAMVGIIAVAIMKATTPIFRFTSGTEFEVYVQDPILYTLVPLYFGYMAFRAVMRKSMNERVLKSTALGVAAGIVTTIVGTFAIPFQNLEGPLRWLLILAQFPIVPVVVGYIVYRITLTIYLAGDQGQADAQFNLGGQYINGEDVPQDYAQAALWYRKAAEEGNAKAQYNLGELYEKGQGVPQDYTQAAFWWGKAAEQGHAFVQFFLGDLYHNGQGVPQDDAQAAAWWRKAAVQGFALAQYHLGLSYDKGLGVPQDYAQATLWYRKAAEQCVAEAQCKLGAWYGMGQSVPQDYVEAYFWSDVAAAGKLDASMAEAATTNRDLALSYLTPADQSRVQQRVLEWFEAHQAKPQ